MTEAKILALVDRGLLRSKEEVEWRAAAGENFPSEDVKEQVVFASFFERGFNLPAGDFFRWLLYYYQLELVSGDIASLLVMEIFFLCKEHWQEIWAYGGCNVHLEVRPQSGVDRHRSPR
jgi:hypothetical protein